jgi:hypothetical protein
VAPFTPLACDMPGHESGLSCVASRGDGKFILTNGKVRRWRARPASVLTTQRSAGSNHASMGSSQAGHACSARARAGRRRQVGALHRRVDEKRTPLTERSFADSSSLTTASSGSANGAWPTMVFLCACSRGTACSRRLSGTRLLVIHVTRVPRARSSQPHKRVPLRCDFSPMATTGGRYAYTGSGCGGVFIFDVLTGAPSRQRPAADIVRRALSAAGLACAGTAVSRLEGHDAIVRDVSWHPTQAVLMSSSVRREPQSQPVGSRERARSQWDGFCRRFRAGPR